jgi:hypothetical protein
VTDPSTGLVLSAGTTATGIGISSDNDVRWRFLAARPAVVQKLWVTYKHTEFGNNSVVDDMKT